MKRGIFFVLAISGIVVEQLCAIERSLSVVKTCADLVRMFIMSPEEIVIQTKNAIDAARSIHNDIVGIAHEQRTYENTLSRLDYLMARSDLAIMHNVMAVIEKLHPLSAMREASRNAQIEMSDYMIEVIAADEHLYEAVVAYAHDGALREALTDGQWYVLRLLMRSYERNGIALSAEKRKQIKALSKTIHSLSLLFMQNIAEDAHHILVTREELAGVDELLVNQLRRHSDGTYYVGVDRPTYVAVMTTCTVEQTRKALQCAYNNRAYPANESVLQQLIAARDDFAQLLGFSSYAHLNLDDSMVGTPDKAHAFLASLLQAALAKEKDELLRIMHATHDLTSIRYVDANFIIQPWNEDFLAHAYQKTHLGFSEERLAEFFPMDSTITRLLELYQDFFNIEFVEVPIEGLWHDEVRCIEVYCSGDRILLGYLLLDLHPRPDKFPHACHSTIVPACFDRNGGIMPAVSLVIGNFPRAHGGRPALWSHTHDVATFFHEFGHAVHALLGRTELAVVAGTSVKRDFVEMPSQMLEEWLFNADILKRISSHYETGEPLSDDFIQRIQRARLLQSGSMVRGQITYALLSLAYYGPGRDKDLYGIMRDIQRSTSLYVAENPDYHPYASFLHLTGYGAQYYGYLWSKVFAVDIFKAIEQRGMSYAQSGEQYVRDVMSVGGGKDPHELLAAFLGRPPQPDAFLEAYGLNSLQ